MVEQISHERPNATIQGVNGTVTRMIYEHLHNAAVPDDVELTLKPDCKKTLRSVKTKDRYHNGKYELNKFDNKMAWSCC